MTSVSEVLADLDAAFRALDLSWYLFGAQALVAHGVPRATADVDVTVLAEPSQARALADALASRGLVLRIEGDLQAWVAQTFVVPVWHTRAGLPVDVVLALSGLERDFAARAQVLDLGASVPVLCVEDLIVSKLLAGRPQDHEDVRALVRLEHDEPRVEALLAEIEAGLDLRGLVARYRGAMPR